MDINWYDYGAKCWSVKKTIHAEITFECRIYQNIEINVLGKTRKDRVNCEYHQFQGHLVVSSIDAKLNSAWVVWHDLEISKVH